MESSDWVSELDRRSAADAAVGVRRRLLRAEADKLALAAHWADLHAEDPADPRAGVVLRGMERAVFIGGDGTPAVGEFAAAELGALLQVSIAAASNLLADALDLRHRLPMLWRAVDEGAVEAWKACQVARRTRTVGLSHAQSLWVDLHTTPSIGSQSWAGFLDRLEAAIVEVDPAAAEQRRRVAALERFVRTGQSNEYGLKTIVAKAAAGDAIFFVAMCDRLAQILRLEGDADPVDVRRSKAIGLLADPARALELLLRHATTSPDDGLPPGDKTDPGPASEADRSQDVPTPPPAPAPVPAGEPGAMPGNPEPFVKPPKVDPAKLRPAAVLHLHMSRESWDAARHGENNGVVRFETVGAVTVPQAVEVLKHCNVTIAPVLDLAENRPVDGYEVPARMREILFQRRPSCVFPWSGQASRRTDADHTVPYLVPDKGGPPGQTRVGNLGFLGRTAHRVKTHAPGWRHHQPEPGVHYWRTPSGYWFLVDHRGTHPLGKHVGLHQRAPDPSPGSSSDRTRSDPNSSHAREAGAPDQDVCWPLTDRSPLEGQLAELLGWDAA